METNAIVNLGMHGTTANGDRVANAGPAVFIGDHQLHAAVRLQMESLTQVARLDCWKAADLKQLNALTQSVEDNIAKVKSDIQKNLSATHNSIYVARARVRAIFDMLEDMWGMSGDYARDEWGICPPYEQYDLKSTEVRNGAARIASGSHLHWLCWQAQSLSQLVETIVELKQNVSKSIVDMQRDAAQKTRKPQGASEPISEAECTVWTDITSRASASKFNRVPPATQRNHDRKPLIIHSLRRMQRNKAWQSLHVWVEFVQHAHLTRSLMSRAISRLSLMNVARAFCRWQEYTTHCHLVTNVVLKMQQMKFSSVFDRWVSWKQEMQTKHKFEATAQRVRTKDTDIDTLQALLTEAQAQQLVHQSEVEQMAAANAELAERQQCAARREAAYLATIETAKSQTATLQRSVQFMEGANSNLVHNHARLVEREAKLSEALIAAGATNSQAIRVSSSLQGRHKTLRLSHVAVEKVHTDAIAVLEAELSASRKCIGHQAEKMDIELHAFTAEWEAKLENATLVIQAMRERDLELTQEQHTTAMAKSTAEWKTKLESARCLQVDAVASQCEAVAAEFEASRKRDLEAMRDQHTAAMARLTSNWEAKLQRVATLPCDVVASHWESVVEEVETSREPSVIEMRDQHTAAITKLAAEQKVNKAAASRGREELQAQHESTLAELLARQKGSHAAAEHATRAAKCQADTALRAASELSQAAGAERARRKEVEAEADVLRQRLTSWDNYNTSGAQPGGGTVGVTLQGKLVESDTKLNLLEETAELLRRKISNINDGLEIANGTIEQLIEHNTSLVNASGSAGTTVTEAVHTVGKAMAAIEQEVAAALVAHADANKALKLRIEKSDTGMTSRKLSQLSPPVGSVLSGHDELVGELAMTEATIACGRAELIASLVARLSTIDGIVSSGTKQWPDAVVGEVANAEGAIASARADLISALVTSGGSPSPQIIEVARDSCLAMAAMESYATSLAAHQNGSVRSDVSVVAHAACDAMAAMESALEECGAVVEREKMRAEVLVDGLDAAKREVKTAKQLASLTAAREVALRSELQQAEMTMPQQSPLGNQRKVSALFTESGPLGLTFQELNTSRIGTAAIKGINLGSAACAHGQLVPGLILAMVQTTSVASMSFKETVAVVKAAARPLTLLFNYAQPEIARPGGANEPGIRQAAADACDMLAIMEAALIAKEGEMQAKIKAARTQAANALRAASEIVAAADSERAKRKEVEAEMQIEREARRIAERWQPMLADAICEACTVMETMELALFETEPVERPQRRRQQRRGISSSSSDRDDSCSGSKDSCSGSDSATASLRSTSSTSTWSNDDAVAAVALRAEVDIQTADRKVRLVQQHARRRIERADQIVGQAQRRLDVMQVEMEQKQVGQTCASQPPFYSKI
jgi:hypothetical protein